MPRVDAPAADGDHRFVARRCARRRHELAPGGNRLELPWLSGGVVQMGKASGVATPANSFIYAALKQTEKAREAWHKSLSLEPNEEVRKKLEPSGTK